MDCPSNPRNRAFKRHYRCSCKKSVMLFLTLLISSTAAFTNAIGARGGAGAGAGAGVGSASESASPFSTTALPFTPNKDNTKGNKHTTVAGKKKKKKDTFIGVSTLGPGDVVLSDLQEPPQAPTKLSQATAFLGDRAPGVALSIALAQLSLAVAKTPLGNHVSPLLWATILGMGYGNVLHRPNARNALAQGIKFSKGRLLRMGIILYGFKITLQQIAGIGFAGLATDAVMVCSTLTLGMKLGQSKYFGLDRATATLIGSGAAICGCSAVLATQPIVGGESHQVSAAVGTVVLGGTLSMFLYPLLFQWIPFLAASPKLMGIYTGSTIHEIAGVVAAGNAMGGDVAFTAVVTKLARVLLLAPVLTTLSWMQNRKCFAEAADQGIPTSNCKIVLPWFAFGFVAVSAVNSVVTFPTALVQLASKSSAFCLLCAMAALGIDSDFQAIRQLGSKPLILAGILWTWLAVGGLGVARFFVGVL